MSAVKSNKTKSGSWETNLHTVVDSWKRVLQVQTIFLREFNLRLATTVGSGETYWLWVYTPNKPTVATLDKYKTYLRGVIATSMHYDPMGTYDVPNGT